MKTRVVWRFVPAQIYFFILFFTIRVYVLLIVLNTSTAAKTRT